jgi:hypothetical protein
MIDPELVKQQAREAEGLLGHPIFKKAVSDLNARLTGALMSSSDPNRKIQLVDELQALRAIELQLTSYVNGGKFIDKRNTHGRR